MSRGEPCEVAVRGEYCWTRQLPDTETLTFVKVVSIAAEPAVVCVGCSNIAYTITTQPGGFEHMVQYTPADVCTPGVKEVIATCGSSAATCTVTVVLVKIKKPTGDPANPDEADEWNERSYDWAATGVVTVVCEAEETPNSDKLRWQIEDVGDKKAKWEPHVDGDEYTGKGQSAMATFMGLPVANSAFGPKIITLTMAEAGIGCKATQKVEIFFEPRAANHPCEPADVPNWFYYWQQIPGLGSENAEYDASLTSHGNTQYKSDLGILWWVASNTQIGNPAYSVNLELGRFTNSVPTAWSGIDTFYVTVQHEEVHLNMFKKGWLHWDDDEDGIANFLETETLPSTNATYFGYQEYRIEVQEDDAEYYAYKHEETLTLKLFDFNDWSSGNTGRQWRRYNVPGR